MDSLSTCMFTGHRVLPGEPWLAEALKTAVIRAASEGTGLFLSGGAMGFDLLAADTVLKLRGQFPRIALQMVLPCRDQDRFFPQDARREYHRILSQADRVTWLADDYYSGCMQARNRAMADLSRTCICYLKSNRGGTAYTVAYARGKGLMIWNLADIPPQFTFREGRL